MRKQAESGAVDYRTVVRLVGGLLPGFEASSSRAFTRQYDDVVHVVDVTFRTMHVPPEPLFAVEGGAWVEQVEQWHFPGGPPVASVPTSAARVRAGHALGQGDLWWRRDLPREQIEGEIGPAMAATVDWLAELPCPGTC